MNRVKAIFSLPELKENHEWACEQGCNVIHPELYKNVYSEKRTKVDNILIEQLAEYYYTCKRGHLLMVWNKVSNDYVTLDDHHYRDPTDHPSLIELLTL